MPTVDRSLCPWSLGQWALAQIPTNQLGKHGGSSTRAGRFTEARPHVAGQSKALNRRVFLGVSDHALRLSGVATQRQASTLAVWLHEAIRCSHTRRARHGAVNTGRALDRLMGGDPE